jgi:hypothetical protein
MACEADKMFTKHMEDRMRQRNISERSVTAILELGEWNERGDRLELPRRALSPVVRKMREDLKVLERLERRGGGSIVLVGDKKITVFTHDRRIRS